MGSTDKAGGWATTALPGLGDCDDENAAFEALSVDDLAALWCRLQHLGVRDQTDQSWAATLYFDCLPHERPERALDLVLAVLRSDAETRVKMQLRDELMTTLVHSHAERLIDRIEAEQAGEPQLRWLLGAVHWLAPSKQLKGRLASIADEAAWRADEAARDTPALRIDFEKLPLPELARAWVDQYSKPEKDRDANWRALMNYEFDRARRDPDRVIALVLEILKIEKSPEMLSLLATGLVEDVIGPGTIDRIEREAAANEQFRDLLGGVWYSNQPAELQARLDMIVQGQHW